MTDRDRWTIVGILAIFLCLLVLTIFYARTLRLAILRCAPESRAMKPEAVWFLFVPVLGLFWHFYLVERVSRSLHNEFVRRGIAADPHPGRTIGLLVCTSTLLSRIPRLEWFIGVIGIGAWIFYWKTIADYSARLAQPAAGAAPAVPA